MTGEGLSPGPAAAAPLVCRDDGTCVGRNECAEFGVGIKTFSQDRSAVGVRAIQIYQSRKWTAGIGPEQIGCDRNTAERAYYRRARVAKGIDHRLVGRLGAFHPDQKKGAGIK